MENLPIAPKKGIDARSLAKTGSGMAILAGIGIVAAKFLLPILAGIVWAGVNLAIGLAVAGVLLIVLTNKRFWRNLSLMNAIIARWFTGWIITWDDFALQEMEIERAEQDREKIAQQTGVINAQIEEKNEELAQAEHDMLEAQATTKQLEIEGTPQTDPEFQFQVSEFSRQQDFIDTIGPINEDLKSMAQMLDTVYKQTEFSIRDARAELKLQKSKLKSYTAGESAMSSAYRILVGDLGLSEDAKQAREMVKQKIALKIGNIQTTLHIIAPIIQQKQLKDRTKVALALEQMKKLEIDGKPIAKALPASNKFSGLLNK